MDQESEQERHKRGIGIVQIPLVKAEKDLEDDLSDVEDMDQGDLQLDCNSSMFRLPVLTCMPSSSWL